MLLASSIQVMKHPTCAGGSQGSLEVNNVQGCKEGPKAYNAALLRLQETHLHREAALLLTSISSAGHADMQSPLKLVASCK